MKTPSANLLPPRPAVWLCLPVLLLSALVPSLAPGATRMAPPARVADVDLSIVLGVPPPPRREVIIERDRPSRDHVWVAGYWANRRGQREWVAGRWERPPQGRTLWVEPRWEKRGHGYAFIEGYWAAPRRDDHHEDRHDDRHDDHGDHH
jgi:hypothetical protein